MIEICSKCGFPQDLCVCETLARETQKIRVRLESRRFRKVYTIVEGFNDKSIDIKGVAKSLKNKFACGGTFKEGMIALQGDHRTKMKNALVELGFPAETIDVI